MITSDRMAAVDVNAAALGVPRSKLMESSGQAVARAVRTAASDGDRVVVVAGRGNNGGDGLVAARFLDGGPPNGDLRGGAGDEAGAADRYNVTTLLLGRPDAIGTEIARDNWDALTAGEADARTVTDSAALDLPEADIIVDAILGTGVAGDLREPAASAVAAINAADASVVSVDVPSGLDPDTGDRGTPTVEPDRVVTFHDAKPGLDTVDAPVTVADIGIPAAAELFVGPGDRLVLDRDPDSHKGDNGEVLVVGGGPYTGAPTIAAQAALRAGADLVRITCPAAVAREIQGFDANLIVRPFDGERLRPAVTDRILERAQTADTLVLGPGLGDDDRTLDAVRDLLARYDGRAVVDADALAVVAEVETDATLVCTPHAGELRGMGGPEVGDDWRKRARAVADYAAELGHVVCCKGRYDVIASGDALRVNRTGNPGMTVGGTGDTLAGVTGALLAGLDPLHAAALGAYATGIAGDRAAAEYGHGLVATDLQTELPAALWPDGT
jgi:hydroxyethylthiazole kinase-like uncharacterized protein yjeF